MRCPATFIGMRIIVFGRVGISAVSGWIALMLPVAMMVLWHRATVLKPRCIKFEDGIAFVSSKSGRGVLLKHSGDAEQDNALASKAEEKLTQMKLWNAGKRYWEEFSRT